MKEIRLLLVDDEREFREATSRALSRRGFQVVQADSGPRALEVIASSSPMIVVLDLKMPGMSGIDTLMEIRKTNRDLPILILTGHGTLDDALAGMRLGIVDFLQKPVDVDQLASHVRGLLSRPRGEPLRERRSGDLAQPLDTYERITVDRPVRELIQLLEHSFQKSVPHRSVLVFDLQGEFVGCVRILNVLDAILPKALKESPYSSYLTGMFLAQSKLMGGRKVKDLIGAQPTVDADAPLLEALHLMVSRGVINLPVLRQGKLVGILRDKDLLQEAKRSQDLINGVR